MSIEQDIDQSYKVIEWLTSSMLKVSSNPKMLGTFLYEYSQRLPQVIDSVMTILPEEHRGVFADFLKASGTMSTEVIKWQMKQK